MNESNKRKITKSLKQIIKMDNLQNVPSHIPTYNNIKAPPSLIPRKKYCDISGYEAPYTDPKTGLRYCSATVYQYINTLPPAMINEYRKLRNAPGNFIIF